LWLGLGITHQPPAIMVVAPVAATMVVEVVAVTAEVAVRADQDNNTTLYQ